MQAAARGRGGVRCLGGGGSLPTRPAGHQPRGTSPPLENRLFAAFFSAAHVCQPTPPSPPCPCSPPARPTPLNAPRTNLAEKNSRGRFRLPAVAPPALFCWRPRAQLMVGRRAACLSLSLLLIARRICASQFLWGRGAHAGRLQRFTGLRDECRGAAATKAECCRKDFCLLKIVLTLWLT